MSVRTKTGRHRADGPARTPIASEQPIGPDGLTDSQRRRFLVRFRSGIGQRPALTPDELQQVAEVAEKLAPVARVVRRPPQ